MTWRIPANGDPVFRLGTLDIPYCKPTTGGAEYLDLDCEDTARMLCSMYYDEACVVTRFPDFAAQGSRHPTTDAIIAAQISFLQQAPRLVDAPKLLRLHEHGNGTGDYELRLSRAVEPIAAGLHGGIGDWELFAIRCGGNAATLMDCIKKLDELAQKPPPPIAPSRFA
ncbi:hypothetical protein MB84_27860 (plasmid) [Pandoraea oxalativorans]|uniref:Uncharacterized protein n=1 Tax=Pandoraea oxalativorans TaxID=573737 RepID=A0A0G3IBL0_9BURK|nr:hypothetical protein MB84_27860 [Pandoraea oxalativorans]